MNLFIDTNVFLSFFHFTNNDLEEIHKLAVLIEQGDVILWLPEQVKNEFKRNRENKIADAIKKLREEQKNKPQFPQICKDYTEYDDIQALLKEYDKKLSFLIEKIINDVSNKTLKADQKISELFEISKFIETNQDLVDKARLRMDVGNPPGKDGSLGDAINWESLLKEVPINQKLYFVADDKDYYSILDSKRPKDFLQDEWQYHKLTEVIFYRGLSQFFEEHYPNIKLASELEKELAIKSLYYSGTFSSTHDAIAKLSKYIEFNNSQVNNLIEIALTNSQVSMIFFDPDIHTFCKDLVSNHENLIQDELKEKICKRLNKPNPDDNFNDIPFEDLV